MVLKQMYPRFDLKIHIDFMVVNLKFKNVWIVRVKGKFKEFMQARSLWKVHGKCASQQNYAWVSNFLHQNTHLLKFCFP